MSKKHILVVDDDPDIRDLLKTYLEGAGYSVAMAADGLSGLSSAQRRTPDLVLLDIGLPAGDGFTVLKRMKALTHLESVPVIVITAQEPRKCREAVLESEACGFLQKPFEREHLLDYVRRAMGEESSPTGESHDCPHCGGQPALDMEMVQKIAQEAARAAVREFAKSLRKKTPAPAGS